MCLGQGLNSYHLCVCVCVYLSVCPSVCLPVCVGPWLALTMQLGSPDRALMQKLGPQKAPHGQEHRLPIINQPGVAAEACSEKIYGNGSLEKSDADPGWHGKNGAIQS